MDDYHAQAVDAVENFKRKFDYNDPAKVNTGIAFLIVCDMLLTGFDAPIEQVMFIDKRVKNHNLLQTIARVNRIAKGKTRGYIIDYIGLTDHLKEALSIYAAEDQKDLEESLKDIASELPVLDARYRRLIQLFKDQGVTDIQGFAEQTITDPKKTYEILEQAVDAMKDLKLRANFEVFLVEVPSRAWTSSCPMRRRTLTRFRSSDSATSSPRSRIVTRTTRFPSPAPGRRYARSSTNI